MLPKITEINNAISKYLLSERKNTDRPVFEIDGTKRSFWRIEPGRFDIKKEGGEIVYKIWIKDGDTRQIDKGGGRILERSEFMDAQRFSLGKTYNFHLDIKFPKEIIFNCNKNIICQRKQFGLGKSMEVAPFLAARLKRGKLLFTYINGYSPDGETQQQILAKIEVNEYLDQWIALDFKIKFSETDGYIHIKMNDKEIVNFSGITASSSIEYPIGKIFQPDFYFKFGIYRNNCKRMIENLQEKLKSIDDKKKREETLMDIKALQATLDSETNNNPMTIYFKNYKVEEIEK